jgi:hypothetical protein
MLRALSFVHAAATTPVQRTAVVFARVTHPYQPSPIPLSGRSAHRPFRGLLGVHSRCGLHTRAVTLVTAIRGLQTFRHLHACPGCFRLERSPGGPCTHWKSAALSRRTWFADIRTRFLRDLSDWSANAGRVVRPPLRKAHARALFGNGSRAGKSYDRAILSELCRERGRSVRRQAPPGRERTAP